jgi:superfamily II DNA helicase RecQ
VQLLSYFGQNSNNCGNCDVCLNKNKNPNNNVVLKSDLLEFLSTPKKLEVIMENYTGDWSNIQQLLRALILNGEVTETTKNQFKTIKK